MITYDFPSKQWCNDGSPDIQDLPSAIQFMNDKINLFAAQVRDMKCHPTSAYEAASWTIKAKEAATYLVTGLASDAPNLAVEAAVRGVSTLAVAQRVAAKAGALMALEACISGISGRHRDNIALLTTAPEVFDYDWSTGWPL